MVAMALADPVLQYAEGVLSGDIPVCRRVIQACERFMKWGEREDMYFDLEEALGRFEFFTDYLVLENGEPFELSLWEKFVVGNIYGWKWVESDLRVVTEAHVWIPRKNGKSTLGAGIALCSFVLDGEPLPNFYCVASDRGQASLLTKYAKGFVKRSPDLQDILRVRVHDILLETEEGEAEFKALHADSDRLDGLNPYGVFGDECHSWKGRGPYDVMNSAFGARDQPLFVIISTTGVYDPTKVGVELFEDGERILEGTIEADSIFVMIYAIDEPEKWSDPQEWAKVNPELGRAKRKSYMAREAAKAARLPSLLNDFKTKQLNIWVKQTEAWIAPERWAACKGEPEYPTDEPCYGALDCANTLDFNSFTLYWPTTHSLKCWFWLPEYTALYLSGRYRDSYLKWERQGFLTLQKDAVALDKRLVKDEILRACQTYDVQSVRYDKAKDGLTVAVELMEDHAIEMVGFAQTPMNFNEPCREFERLVTEGFIRHGNNPVLDWHVSNVCQKKNASDLIMPARSSEYVKIDGVVTTVMAIGGALLDGGNDQPQIFV